MPHPRPPRRAAQLAAAATSVALSLAPTTLANTPSWSSPVSGRWLDPANWSTAALPTPADPVTIAAAGGPYTVTLDGGTAAGPLTLNNPDATLLLDTTLSPSLVLTTAGDINIAAGTLALHNHDSGIFVRSPSSTSLVNLTNAGRIDYTMDLPFQSYASATFDNLANVSNSGSIEVHDGPANRPDVVLQFKSPNTTTSAFTNTGTLRTGARSRIEAYTATFNQNTGSLDGTVYFNGRDFNHNGGSVGTVVFSQAFYGLVSLNLAPTAGGGTFVARSPLWVNSDVAAGQTVYVAPTSRGALMGGTLTNAGYILVGADPLATSASLGSPTLFALPHPTDTLTNTGTLDINSPLSSPSTITGNVVNSGTVRVATPYPNLTFSYGTSLAGNWTNSGSVSIAAGSSTALSTGSSFTQNAGGSLAIAAEPLTLTNGHFYYNGGTVSGAITLSNSTVHFAPGLTSGGGTFTYSGSFAPATGNIPAGVTVVHTLGSTVPIGLPSFTNAGALLTSASTPNTSLRPTYRLDNFAGTLTNTGSIGGTLKGVDRGADLLINGNLVNTGNIKANYLSVSGSPSTTLPRISFDQNAGTLLVDDLCLITRATFNYNGGTITGKPVGISDSTLNIAPNTNPASFTFFTGANTLHGSPAAGSTLALDSLTGVPVTVSVTADPFTNAGTLSFASVLGPCTSTLTVTGSGTLANTGTLSVTRGYGGTRTLNANVTNTGTLSVGPGATLTLTGSLSTTTTLDLQGTLDLRGPLTWSYTTPSPIDTLRSLLAASHLTNTTADSTHRLAYTTTFSGEPTAPSPSLTVNLALTGDANLDGRLNADDYALIDRAFAKSLSNALWQDGDFNYDGTVTSADYLLLDTAYLKQQGGAPAFLAERQSQFGDTYVSTLLASVPEPASLAACGLALLPLLRRRTKS